MMSAVRNWIESYLGRGEAAPTVPTMDGALHPNTALDDCEAVLGIAAPDNLLVRGDDLWFTSGADLFRLLPGAREPELIHSYEVAVSCLAGAGDLLAIGTEDGDIHLSHDGSVPTGTALATMTCPVAMTFSPSRGLLVCDGSTDHAPQQWKRDLMSHGSSGRVVGVDLETGRETAIAGNLRYPFGIVEMDKGDLVISEAWAARLVRLREGPAQTVLSDLPGYPSRLTVAQGGGYWLTVLAPRSQLVELVLRQGPYRKRMMEEVEEQFWVAPTLCAATSYLEPLQGGAIRTHGIIKPWAPTRSYGLLVRLNDAFQPIDSWHSRADGTRHGLTSCAEWDSVPHVSSKGGNELLRVSESGNGVVQ